MSRYFALLSILALRLFYQPSAAETITPFASPAPPPPFVAVQQAKLLQFNATVTGTRITLDWTVLENESAELFEVERSTDGKTFHLAALVLGTDKPTTDSYRFYEKAGNQKVLYRIKLVNKNKEAEYSTVVETGPPA